MMGKSARDRLLEYSNQHNQVINAIREMTDRSFAEKKSFASATGTLTVMLSDAIMLLPKSKREEFLLWIQRQ